MFTESFLGVNDALRAISTEPLDLSPFHVGDA